jgi:sporulation protein YlmC with PRC-barrel domain
MDVTDMIGLEVYTGSALLVGSVKDVILDTEEYAVSGLYLQHPNPRLVEGSTNIAIPFRWVRSVGDIIVLKFFPKYIRTGKNPEKGAEKGEEAQLDDDLQVS